MKYLLFCGLLLMGAQAFAQKTFSGSYITHEGEKVAVTFTNYRQWNHNPSQVKVQTAEGKDLTLTPAGVRSFTVDGYDTYVSRRFTRLLNPIGDVSGYQQLPNRDSVETIEGFLLLLAEGAGVRLYKYSDRQRENFFVEKDSLQELRYKIYTNEAGRLVHDADYREQLRVLFADRMAAGLKLGNAVGNLEYKEAPLRKFVEQAVGVTAKKKRKYPSEFMVLGGAAYNTFDVSSERYKSLGSVSADYGSQVTPVIGIGFIDYSQRNFARNFVSIQARYYSYKNSGTYTQYGEEKEVTFQSDVISLSLALGRNLIQAPQFSWYAAVASNGSYLPNSRGNYDYENSIIISSAPDKVSLFSHNIVLQSGVRMKNGIGLWLHYHLLPTEVYQLPQFHHEHRTLQFGAEWRFRKK